MYNMPMSGRPTKYSEEAVQKAEKYFATCRVNGSIPFIEELALDLDVHDDTIVEWAKAHDEFSATVRKLKLLQKLSLKKGALSKHLQPTTAIFLLKANHGMNDEEKDEPERVTDIHIHYVGTTPTTLEDAMANKKSALKEFEKAEKAIEELSGESSPALDSEN